VISLGVQRAGHHAKSPMICFTSSLIRELYHFATDFVHVLLQLVGTDIVKTLFKYTVSYKHLTLMIETSELLM